MNGGAALDLSVNGKEYAVSMASSIDRTRNSSLSTESKSGEPTVEMGEVRSVGDDQFNKLINKAIKAAQGISTELEISVHKETNDLIVRVINKDTGDLIREIPSEKMIDMIQKFVEMSGILIDKKV
ncbi:flagellar protein FlaG [Bacillus sp. 3255]|uniref:flagellar protein FlaG n=1 Tax=Bacillus sp. 3255 TaxID=2817904 RepID=UPI00286D1F75|nr:flagellar protein FlaG [Bacillus sp. 3255]